MKLEYTKIRIEISDGKSIHQVWQSKSDMAGIKVFLYSESPNTVWDLTYKMKYPRTLTKTLAIHFVKLALAEIKAEQANKEANQALTELNKTA